MDHREPHKRGTRGSLIKKGEVTTQAAAGRMPLGDGGGTTSQRKLEMSGSRFSGKDHILAHTSTLAS
jgi:hypothetical protein